MNRITTIGENRLTSNVIFDKEVIVTSPSDALSSLNEVLIKQDSRLNKLESNTKWLYKYGGIGSGGSGGGGSSEESFRVEIQD